MHFVEECANRGPHRLDEFYGCGGGAATGGWGAGAWQGVPPSGPGGRRGGAGRLVLVNRNVAIYGNLIIHTGNDGYVYALHAATRELAWEAEILDYRTVLVRHMSGPIIANGKGDLGAQLPAGQRSDRLRHRRARCRHRHRAVADPPHARAARAGRPHGDVGHLPRTEVSARRLGPEAPLPQLDAGPRRRHRRNPVGTTGTTTTRWRIRHGRLR